MPSKLLERARRDDGPLDVPSVITPGITASPTSVWAWVVLPTRATDELNTDHLIRLTLDGASALRRLLPKDAPFHVKVQWSRWSGDEYVADELATLGEPTAGQRAYIELGGRRIADNRFPRRQVLLGVLVPTDTGAAIPAQLRSRTRRVAGESAEIEDALLVLNRAAADARSWIDRMAGSAFKARAATVREIAWALRHDLRRTVSWLPDGSLASGGQVARLLSGSYVVPQADHVEVATDEGVRYVRCLSATVTGFPAADLALPGGEWLKDLAIADDLDDAHPEPVEVSIRGRNLSPTAAAKIMQEALSLSKEQGREAAKGVAEEPPDEIIEAREALPARLSEVRSGRVSMVADNVVWIVEADSLPALNKRTNAVIDHYGGKGIDLWIPEHVQDILWQETVLGDRLRFADTEQFRPMSTLVGGWFHGGSELGDATGPVLGVNIGSTPGPFRSRLSDAALEGKPVTTVFVGQSGAGKSTGVMLATGAESIYGAWAFINDMKGDLHGIVPFVERFGVQVTELSTEQAASGSLDPFRYVAEPMEAASRALDNLLVMLPESTASTSEGMIRQHANLVAEYDNPDNRSTAAVIRLMAGSSDPLVAKVGDELLGLSRDPLARPVAGVPDLSARQLPTGPGLVYMRLPGNRLPDRQTLRANWKPGERLTVGLVQAAFDYANYTAARVTGIPKVIALTELHLVTGFDWGRQFVARTARLGRALDNSLLLDTQAVAELASIEGLLDQVSAAYAFRVQTDDEADAQAKLLGLNPEPMVRARQQSWLPGECEARDRHGRVAPVMFDYLDAGIAAVLDTTPKRRTPELVAEPAV